MAPKIKLIRSVEYLHSSEEGVIDFERTKKILAELAAEKERPADYDIILDFRRTQINLTTSTLN